MSRGVGLYTLGSLYRTEDTLCYRGEIVRAVKVNGLLRFRDVWTCSHEHRQRTEARDCADLHLRILPLDA
jgi:hypothetical protein